MNTSLQNYSKYSNYLRKSFRKVNPQHQSYLELVLSIVGVLFFAWYAIRPTLITITELYREIEIRSEIASKLDQKINELVAANTVYETAEPQLAFLDEALPPESGITEFNQQLETLANESNVQLTSFLYQSFPLDKKMVTKSAKSNAKKSGESDPWRSVDFELTATGKYSNLKNLIFELSNLRRIIITKQISIQNEIPNGQTSDELNLRLSGKILFL